jgi:putative transposase
VPRGADDALVQVAPLLRLVPKWTAALEEDVPEERARDLRHHEATGRPLGGDGFVERLERVLGRLLRPGKPGRKKKVAGK